MVTVVGASSLSSFKPMDASSSSSSSEPPPPPHPPPPPTRLHHHDGQTPSSCSSSSYLLQLRKVAWESLKSTLSIPSLVDHVTKKFLLLPTSDSWSEECESVLTLLYVALHYPTAVTSLFAKGVAVEFFGRWIADNDNPEVSCASALFTDTVKFADFSILLLLLGNLLPQEVETSQLEECLTWSSEWSPDASPPEWLLDASGCEGDFTSLKNLLLASSMMLKGVPWQVKSTGGYAAGITDFLVACRLYKEGDYRESLTRLQDIDSEKCCIDLQGWVFWLTGLGLLKLGKSQTALLKLQAAAEKCDSCIPAIFNISQIFNGMGVGAAELETLSLLSVSGEDWQPYATMDLQSSVLRLHYPPPQNLSCRALYMLAARCFQMEMYTESCDNVTSLLQKLQNTTLGPSESYQTLFRPEDNVPDLPSYESIIVLQALGYFQNEDYETTLTVLSKLDEKDLSQFNYYEDPENDKMACLITATASFIKSEALSKLDKEVDALHECIKLERDLSWVRGFSDTGWESSILILKTLLYSTMSVLHSLKGNSQSHRHYKHLASQNLGLLSKNRSTPAWGELTLSCTIMMDNIHYTLTDKLSTLV